MDFSKSSPKLLAFLKRKYSTSGSLYSPDQPTFITKGKHATIFLSPDWEAGCELARALLKKGYIVTYRTRRLPAYEIEHIEGAPPLRFPDSFN